MAILDRIPDLSDRELESLHANAVRLKDAGSVIQQRQAEELLAPLAAALAERKAARVEAQAETRRVAASAKKMKTKSAV